MSHVLTIMVVDDSPTQRVMLRVVLEERGYRVVDAETGELADQLMVAERPDAVLLDWDLPDMEGPELLRRWANHPEFRWVPVLMVTTHKGGDKVKLALETGAIDFMHKPPDEVELFARLGNALRIRTLQDELRWLAARDPLTGLFNRRVFMERLKQEFSRSRRHGHDLSLGIADLDHFKQVNDKHGHDAGDMILGQFAGFLTSQLRDSDVGARYGGEEFAMILPETPMGGGVHTLERLRGIAAATTWGSEELPIQMTFSVGVASLGETGASDPEALIKAADVALYQAKAAGRNQVVAAAPGSG